MNASVLYSSNSKLNKQIKELPSESEGLAIFNIFKIIASICNACLSKIYEYLPTPSVPSFTETSKHISCECNGCVGYLDHENDKIELRLLYENKSRNELNHLKYKNKNYKPCLVGKCSNSQAKSVTCTPWQQTPGKNPVPFGYSKQINLMQLSKFGMLGKPYEKFMQDYQRTPVESYPLIFQGNQVGVYNPICEKVFYLCGRCECKNKSQLKQSLGDNLDPQKQKGADSSFCKCSLCECLSCPFQEEASFAGSLESFKTSAMRNFVENEWKLRGEHEIQACRTAKDCKHFRGSTNIIVSKSIDEKRSVKSNISGRKTYQFPQQTNTIKKSPVKEMLDNVYAYTPDFEVEENDKNVSTVNRNTIIIDQRRRRKSGLYTVKDEETNTETNTTNKCTETVNSSSSKKHGVDNKVKNYEYTLKIEIITPNFDDNIKQSMKQSIKRASKNKIKEQTQKVMKDVIKDISKNSLLQDMFVPENLSRLSALQTSDSKILGDTESEEQNKRRSILKKISPSSFKSTPTEDQHSLDMVMTRPRGSKVEDFIVGCVTPLQKTSRNKGIGININKSAIPSKDESVLSQNGFFPSYPSMMRAVDEVEKLVSCVDAPATDVKKFDNCLDDLRVQEPCVRRVSRHTVSLKWKLPKLIEEIMGYEILVDGKTIEKILNSKRCLAVVSCLPPVKRLMITIRSLPKNPELRGLYPCTTIGYQPRANKFIRI